MIVGLNRRKAGFISHRLICYSNVCIRDYDFRTGSYTYVRLLTNVANRNLPVSRNSLAKHAAHSVVMTNDPFCRQSLPCTIMSGPLMSYCAIASSASNSTLFWWCYQSRLLATLSGVHAENAQRRRSNAVAGAALTPHLSTISLVTTGRATR